MSALPDRGQEDRDLVALTIGGDNRAFGLLISRHQRAIRSLGIGFLRNEEDVGDFVQEVFLKAYRSLGSFQGRSQFSTWLYRIAYNTGVNTVKRRKEYKSLSEDVDLPDLDNPERQALRTAARQAVRQAVSELPERYRVCVDLYFFYDLSYPDIEMVTGFPVNTIKSHVFRAKMLLREKLADFEEGGVP